MADSSREVIDFSFLSGFEKKAASDHPQRSENELPKDHPISTLRNETREVSSITANVLDLLEINDEASVALFTDEELLELMEYDDDVVATVVETIDIKRAPETQEEATEHFYKWLKMQNQNLDRKLNNLNNSEQKQTIIKSNMIKRIIQKNEYIDWVKANCDFDTDEFSFFEEDVQFVSAFQLHVENHILQKLSTKHTLLKVNVSAGIMGTYVDKCIQTDDVEAKFMDKMTDCLPKSEIYQSEAHVIKLGVTGEIYAYNEITQALKDTKEAIDTTVMLSKAGPAEDAAGTDFIIRVGNRDGAREIHLEAKVMVSGTAGVYVTRSDASGLVTYDGPQQIDARIQDIPPGFLQTVRTNPRIAAGVSLRFNSWIDEEDRKHQRELIVARLVPLLL